MPDNISRAEYQSGIEQIVDIIEDEAETEDDINELVFDSVDSHQWIIYTSYHLDVLRHSDGPEEWKHLVGDGDDWRDVIQAMAFDAMRTDVWEEIGTRGMR